MGYACPVCETPQRDGEHLAHHLAFTAMLHGDDHEAWLDEHVSDWGERDPAGLAEAVTAHAAEAEYHEVFEDTADRSPSRPDVAPGGHGQGHRHEHGHGHEGATDSRSALRDPDPSELDPEAAAAVREARELTREMYANGADEAGGEGVADTNETDKADGESVADTDETDEADGGSSTDDHSDS